MTPWPDAESSMAQPCGTCQRCGGTLYAYLFHTCSTAIRWSPPPSDLSLPLRDLSPMGGGPKP